MWKNAMHVQLAREIQHRLQIALSEEEADSLLSSRSDFEIVRLVALYQ
jgi:hypothetical protein